jgi:hypothetical protein
MTSLDGEQGDQIERIFAIGRLITLGSFVKITIPVGPTFLSKAKDIS